MSTSDSDDDKPILELIKKRKLQAADEAKKQAQSAPAPVAKKVKTESSTNSASKRSSEESKPASSSSKSSGRSSNGNVHYSADFYETEKGLMVQRLLCRWWYAITWPRPEDIPETPAGYEPLDGFPGVFISTASDTLGQIIDTRDKSTCPSLKNISQWSSERVQEVCIEAYQGQMEVLKKLEGEDCRLYRTLKHELREVKHIDTGKADREARKFDFSNR